MALLLLALSCVRTPNGTPDLDGLSDDAPAHTPAPRSDLDRACLGGDGRSCYALAGRLLGRLAVSVAAGREDNALLEEAWTLLNLACDLGVPEGCVEAGKPFRACELGLQSGCRQATPRGPLAERLQLCRAGHAPACDTVTDFDIVLDARALRPGATVHRGDITVERPGHYSHGVGIPHVRLFNADAAKTTVLSDGTVLIHLDEHMPPPHPTHNGVESWSVPRRYVHYRHEGAVATRLALDGWALGAGRMNSAGLELVAVQRHPWSVIEDLALADPRRSTIRRLGIPQTVRDWAWTDDGGAVATDSTILVLDADAHVTDTLDLQATAVSFGAGRVGWVDSESRAFLRDRAGTTVHLGDDVRSLWVAPDGAWVALARMHEAEVVGPDGRSLATIPMPLALRGNGPDRLLELWAPTDGSWLTLRGPDSAMAVKLGPSRPVPLVSGTYTAPPHTPEIPSFVAGSIDGSVTLDGRALEGVDVVVVPDLPMDVPIAGRHVRTDAQGRFHVDSIGGRAPGVGAPVNRTGSRRADRRTSRFRRPVA